MKLSVGGGASGYSDHWTLTAVYGYQSGGRQHYKARKQRYNRNNPVSYLQDTGSNPALAIVFPSINSFKCSKRRNQLAAMTLTVVRCGRVREGEEEVP